MTNPAPRAPLAVLVVDDTRDCAESLAGVLRAYGHEARTAHTPTEAVIAAAAWPPDVVVMDIGIPGMDGYRLAQKVCAQLTRKPFLVAVTGYGDLEERSRQEGFDHHFVKPADPAELLRLLDAHARRRRRPGRTAPPPLVPVTRAP